MFSGAGRSVLGMNSSTNRDRDWYGGSETQVSRPCSAISVERDPFLENTAKERNAFYSSFYRDSPASTIAAGLQINTGGSNMPALTLSRPSSASSTAMFTPRSPSHITTKSPTHSLGHNTHYHPYSGGTTGPNGAQLSRRPSSGRANGLNVINSNSSYAAQSKSTSGSNKHANQAQYLLNAGSYDFQEKNRYEDFGMTSMDINDDDSNPGKFQDFEDDDDMSYVPSLRCDMMERRNSFDEFGF